MQPGHITVDLASDADLSDEAVDALAELLVGAYMADGAEGAAA